VINFRVSGIAAGIAFVLSLIIGILSGAGFPYLLLRALVFAGVFFALSGLGFWAVSRFLPELLSEGGGADGGDDFDIAVPGSRVDISVGSSVEGAFPEDASDSVDDIAGRPSAVRKQSISPLDQNEDSGYNEERGFDSLAASESLGDDSTDALPDMGSLSGDSDDDDDEEDLGMDSFDPPPEQPRRSSSKKPALAGDFDPKDLARAIQTVLKKEEKG